GHPRPRLGRGHHPGPGGRHRSRRAPGRRGVDRADHRRRGEAGEGRRPPEGVRRRREPAVHGGERSTIPRDTAAAEQFADEHPELATFVRQVSTARSRTAQLGPDWPRTAKAIYTANQRVLVDDTDPAEAFDEAARTVDASRTES